MSYPYSIAAANEVLRAAVEWRRYVSIAGPQGHRPPPRSAALAVAVDRYLAETAVETPVTPKEKGD